MTVQTQRPDPTPVIGPVVGIDLGLTTLAMCSDGTRIQHPRAWARGLRTVRRRSRAVTRKRPGSRDRANAVLALARAHRRVRNQRLDTLHKATTMLAKTKSVIVVEDLHVAVVRNRHLTRSIADASWGRVPPPARLQMRLVWLQAGRGRPLVPVIQDVLGVRVGQV